MCDKFVVSTQNMQNLKYLSPISGKSVFKKRLVIHYTGLNNT